jgi:hypothetical protein
MDTEENIISYTGRYNTPINMAKEGKINMESTPLNPETIVPGENELPAMLVPGESVIDSESIEKYKASIQKLADGYSDAVAEQQAKLDYEASPSDEWELAGEDGWLEQGVVDPSPLTKREKLYAIQESKRAAKVQVDQKFVMLGWLIAIGIAFVASAIVSFNGITSVAEFVGLSATWMAGLFFFFVELMYLIFLVAYLVLASRVDEDGEPEKTGGALWGMISFAAIAVGANAFHTLDYWQWDITNPQVWAGVILSISAPIAIISASKMASRVVFAKAIKL